MFSLAANEAEECSMLDRPNGPLKQGLKNICLKSKENLYVSLSTFPEYWSFMII